ncbi:MAG: 30S ribosomal protein S9 [Waddliaceae bacterium]|nr:30S ribosomal protein S9 [Waddliaceae bacterium]
MEETLAKGRRKTAVASVRLRPGTGKVNVNGREMKQYWPVELQRTTVMAPITHLEREGKYDIIIRVKGGGLEGQAEAARLGIARALVKEEEERRGSLKGLGYLKRDPRKRERKKYGQKGARKSFQFSKR